MDFLSACDEKPELAKKHHRKVYRALGAYCLLIVISAILHFTLPDDFVENAVNERVIVKLEEDYDNEIFNNEMGELRRWLQQKGIRLD